jgi:hypothetical protein
VGSENVVRSFRREHQELLDRLYALLDELHLRPLDLVRELRRDGHRIRFLAELNEDQLRKQVEDCERIAAKVRGPGQEGA